MKRKHSVLYILISLLVFVCFECTAQSAIKTYEIPTIVIIAQDNIEDIEKEYANNFHTINPSNSIFLKHALGDTLENLTFTESAIRFSGSERKNGQEINLRGFSSKNVITAIDGVKTRFYSQHDGSIFIDPMLISRIGIYKGANSHIYGSGGIAGYVSYNTLSFADILQDGKDIGILAKAGYETVDKDRSLLLGYASRFGDDNKIMIVGLKRKSSDIKLSNGDRLSSDDDIHSVLLKSELNIFDNHRLLFNYHFYQNDSIEPNNSQISEVEAELSKTKNSFTKLAQLTDKRVQNNLFSINHKYFSNGDFSLNTTVYFQKVSTKKEELTADGVDPLGTLKEREIKSYGIDSFADLHDGWFAGFEVNRDIQNASKNNLLSSLAPNGKTTSFGVFLGKDFAFDKKFGPYTLHIIPTVRLDHFDLKSSTLNQRSDNEFSYALKASLDDKNRSFYASFARSFRSPNITELFAQGQHFRVGPLVNNFVANPQLLSEKGLSYEIGFTHQADGFLFGRFEEAEGIAFKEADNNLFKISLYYTDYKDYIDQRVLGYNVGTAQCPFPYAEAMKPDLYTCSAGITQFVNVSNAEVKGFEIEDRYKYKNFTYVASLAKSFGSDKDTGESLGSIIPLTFSNELQYKIDRWNFGLQAKLADRLFVKKLSGYGVFNVISTYKIDDNLILSLRIDNIFNKKYEKTYSQVFAAARTLKVQFSYRW